MLGRLPYEVEGFFINYLNNNCKYLCYNNKMGYTLNILILLLGLSIADINEKFSDILNGQKIPTQSELLTMYEHFLVEFRSNEEMEAINPDKLQTW